MSDDIADFIDDVRESFDIDAWLKALALTCIDHMKYIKSLEENRPEEITYDDIGLLELEKGFLTLYSIYKDGEFPEHKESKH